MTKQTLIEAYQNYKRHMCEIKQASGPRTLRTRKIAGGAMIEMIQDYANENGLNAENVRFDLMAGAL